MDLDFTKLPRFKNDAMKVWALIPQWAHAYQVPNEAIIQQLYIAHAWCDSNPKKAPKKQIARFLWSWMGQAKRYNNLVVKKREGPKPAQPEPKEDMTFEEMQEIRRRNMPQRGTLASEHKGAIDTETISNV